MHYRNKQEIYSGINVQLYTSCTELSNSILERFRTATVAVVLIKMQVTSLLLLFATTAIIATAQSQGIAMYILN